MSRPLFHYIEIVRRAVVALLACLLISGCGSQPKEGDYVTKIMAIRAAKDQSFKNDQDSPVPADKKATLIPDRKSVV